VDIGPCSFLSSFRYDRCEPHKDLPVSIRSANLQICKSANLQICKHPRSMRPCQLCFNGSKPRFFNAFCMGLHGTWVNSLIHYAGAQAAQAEQQTGAVSKLVQV